MANLNERLCRHCDNPYSLEYTDKSGYKSILKTEYCSRSCASKSRTNRGCIVPDVGAQALKDKAIRFIQEQDSYCTKDEICTGVRHSSKTFAKHGLKVSSLNAELGYLKPKSKFQDTVGTFLKETFLEVETEKKFDGLVGTKGHPLRVDFYIPEINTVVEADGSQHSDPNHPWREWNNGTVSSYDEIKDKFFKDRGIKVVRVPYKRNLKKSDVSSRLS